MVSWQLTFLSLLHRHDNLNLVQIRRKTVTLFKCSARTKLVGQYMSSPDWFIIINNGLIWPSNIYLITHWLIEKASQLHSLPSVPRKLAWDSSAWMLQLLWWNRWWPHWRCCLTEGWGPRKQMVLAGNAINHPNFRWFIYTTHKNCDDRGMVQMALLYQHDISLSKTWQKVSWWLME